MRIGFDAKRAFFNHSGLGNYSRTLISQLCELFPENEYVLFSPKDKTSFKAFPPLNSTTRYPNTFPFKKFPSLWRSFYMGRSIAKQDIHIFPGLSNELPMDIKKSNARSVVTIHDLIFLRYPNLYKRADRVIYRNKFQQSCNMADAVVAISEQTKADIVNFLNISPEKIHVIYQGCSPLYYEKASQDTKNHIRTRHSLPREYMLYVGTIEERKNLLQLVKAMHEFKITIPLVVVGRQTPYYEKVKTYIEQNKLKGIYFLKNLEQEELPGIYQMAELFLYPSSFEGFGIPILEALNSGIPVIAGTGGCMEETGGRGSIYVNPMNTEEIAESINRVLRNPDLKSSMVSEGLEHAAYFREDRTAKEMMKLYKKILTNE